MVLRLDMDDKGSVVTRPLDWSEALPHPEETKVICIVVGNSSLNWAIHEGKNLSFTPSLFWRTPPVEESELKEDSPSKILSRHVPNQVQEDLFGPSVPAARMTKETANRVAAAKRVPARTIYLLSTNSDNEKALVYIFSEACHRMFRLESTDFFTAEQGCYKSFGPDRAACLFSGIKARDAATPLLVMDAGTAWTYTGLDADGKIMGGGISPGFGARFRALSDYCGKLPSIGYAEYTKVVNEIDDKKRSALPAFAKDTKSAILTSVFQEVNMHCRGIIRQFLATTKEAAASESDKTISVATVDGTTDINGSAATLAPTISQQTEPETTHATAAAKENKPRVPPSPSAENEKMSSKNEGSGKKVSGTKPWIVITGGDSTFLMRCMSLYGPGFPGDLGPPLSNEDFILEEVKHLSHYGMGRLIDAKFVECRAQVSKDDELRDLIIGQRVAKEFDEEDKDAEFIYRGSVMSVLRGKDIEDDLFRVRYDDGDQEQLLLAEIYEALKLYARVGEKGKPDSHVWTEQRRNERKEGSDESAKKLMEGVPGLEVTIQKHAEKENAEKAAKAAAVAAASASTTAPPVAEVHIPSNMPPTKSAKRQQETPGKRGVPKKAKVMEDDTEDGTKYLKTRVAKYFEIENEEGKLENVLYKGAVTEYDKESKFWHIIYDDGDEEDFDKNDLMAAIQLQHETAKPTAGDSQQVEPAPVSNLTTATVQPAE